MPVTSNTTTTRNQLSPGGTDGNIYGQDTADKIAFFGSTPSAQVAITAPATGATLATVVTSVQALVAELQSKGLIG